MNPSTAQAEAIVDELVRNEVHRVVLSPGSRNAPLAYAAHRAAQAGRLELHVRIDERSAGFLALGMVARSRRPVAVICTSGTAATNLHPAVTEAFHAGIPLIALTADRPPELRAAGANQTIVQHGLFGTAVRMFDELAVAENRPGQNAYWRSQICRACSVARAGTGGGPVHLNLPFREPLVPTGDDQWCESLEGRAGRAKWTEISTGGGRSSTLSGTTSARGLVLVADQAAESAGLWGQRRGWPVLAETGAVGVPGGSAIGTGMWLLDLPEFVRAHHPEQVVCAGRPTVFRQVQRLLADTDIEVLLAHAGSQWPAPAHNLAEVAEAVGSPDGPVDPDWLTSWQEADQKATAALHGAVDLEHWPSGPAVARDLVQALPTGALLTLGSSNPTRDVALAAPHRPDVQVHRNRGAAGIDGTVSTAVGAALAHRGPSYALLGDLTFLHDANGLLLGPHEQRPDLTIVVLNDDGGGIFSLLEQGSPENSDGFERVFGTPHGTDLAALCAAHNVEYVPVRQRSEFAEALRPRPGLRVVEIRVDRSELRAAHERLAAAVRSAVLG